jgi:predicted nucleotidyltransferase
MMNVHSRWRLRLARRLAARLASFGAVEAVAAIGSVARGYADAYSDLELLIIWDRQPDEALRADVMHRLEARFRYPPEDPAHGHSLLIDGVPVDLWHTTQAAEDTLIDSVLHDFSIDLVANNRAEVMASCLPLHGAPILHGFKERVARYPDELAFRFLENHVPLFHLRQLHLAARRDNPTLFLRLLTEAQCTLFLVLLAINRVYFPTFKWIYPVLDTLPTAPAGAGRRLRDMFSAAPPDAAARLRDLLRDTLDLVEARYPRLDTTYARRGLDQTPQTYARATA